MSSPAGSKKETSPVRPRAAQRAGRASAAAAGDESRVDAAANLLRNMILDLSLPPGIRVDDRMLVEEFRLGRTPAREALNRLAAEGLIQIQRNKGAFVRPLDINNVRQFFDAYFALERLVGYFCRTTHADLVSDLEAIDAQYGAILANPPLSRPHFLELTRINAAFHLRLAAATENEYIAEFSARLHNQARRISYFIFLADLEVPEGMRKHQKKVTRDHRDLIRAVRMQENPTLVELLTSHAALFRGRIMRVIGDETALRSPLPTRN